jgi:hypothetical protein
MERAAIVDLLHMQALIEPTSAAEAKSLLVRLVAMLTKMCRYTRTNTRTRTS